MDTREKLSFRIDSFTPDTLPMARLAEYLTRLANLYGSVSDVHFDKIKKGSAILQVAVDNHAYPKVVQRLQSVKNGTNDSEAKKAYDSIDQLLRSDNAIGSISLEKGGKVLEFPGRKAVAPQTYTISQPTTVDGVVIKIGGKDDTIPVTLRDQEGKLINCQIRGAAHAKALSRHYLEAPIRVHGTGKWIRHEDGVWEIESLTISTYEELDTLPLDTVLAEIQNVRGMGWSAMENPLQEWRKLRGLE